jgi:peroxiredoxin
MDGAHAFLFLARVTDSTLSGTFYSGKHFKAPFEGKRNERFELPDPETLTYLKEGYETLSFTFPDADGNKISLDDPQYKDKVVIVQIMGTWCPNSLDESKFLVEYLANHPEQDLEVIALAVEYATTEKDAIKGINRLKEGIGVPYPVLLAQYGSWDKKTANEKLPMLNHILSYPTTIFIDKQGKVRKILTSFNGPATGEKYKEFSDDFDTFVKNLLAE